ncbi:MAG TPA: tetratricopeptide repeat protein [Rhizobiaceae bacterium]|nr:tetratricopeptide repeat protein [Rhizobiaceae bacterium]
MLKLGFLAFLVLSLTGTPSLAAEELTPVPKREPSAPLSPEALHKARLDKLFEQLKRENNENAAQITAQQIWRLWFDSGSATVDLLMQWSAKAIRDRKYYVALDFLNQVVALDPKYAEGWNQLATIYYLNGNYAKSMADIDRTLQLEPRHFGALAGLAQIMEVTGHKKRALEAYEKILAIYPMMRSAQTKVEALTQELAGQPI